MTIFLLFHKGQGLSEFTFGDFLLLFSGERVVLNLQPYTGDDFNIRTLADRIKDLGQLVYLYPDIPKHVAFHTYYSSIEREYSYMYSPSASR